MKTLFRAKEKNTDNYIIGYEYYNHIEDEYYITHYLTGNNYKIDINTRSIHFPDMLDSQGNKIFASLSENGKGGDILEYSRMTNKMWCEGKEAQIKATLCKFNASGLNILSILKSKDNDNFKIIGIQE